MSASRIILAFLPSFCQKLSKLVEIDEVLTKTILHSFFETQCSCDKFSDNLFAIS